MGQSTAAGELERGAKGAQLTPSDGFLRDDDDDSIYTVAEDTLDADDPIFPRAATRIGTKFQTVVEDDLDESGALVPKSTTGQSAIACRLPFAAFRADLGALVIQCTLPSFPSVEETARSDSSVGR